MLYRFYAFSFKRGKRGILYLSVLFLTAFILPEHPETIPSAVKTGFVKKEKYSVIKPADELITEMPQTVTSLICTHSAGGKHDFYSEGDYRRPGSPARQTYNNPVLPGFHPDPSICRDGEDYYLVTSTFEYYPGVPVYQSRDLVNWKLTGYALHTPGHLNLDQVECSGGIYAPTIRYHNFRFYMITTLVGQTTGSVRGNFIVTADHPAGPWSLPHVIEGAVGIDPSLFFDDDGKAYYTGNCTPANPVWDKHRDIWIQEIDLNDWKLKGERKILLDGSEYYQKGNLDGGILSGVNNYEASHMYKKNGFYYLLISHGGTSQNHAVSIWRSRNIMGPYDMNPSNPILTHRDLPKDYPITSTGHADLVETPDGEWWMVYLAKRPVGGENHILGRETFLSPVDWSEEWPVVNPDGVTGRAEMNHFKPDIKHKQSKTRIIRDGFNSGKLNLIWNFIRTPREEWWSLDKRKGFLRIKLRPEQISEKVNPSFIGRRLEINDFKIALKMEFKPGNEREEAGLVIIRDRNSWFSYTVQVVNGNTILALHRKTGPEERDSLLASVGIPSGNLILKVTAENSFYHYRYSTGGKEWKTLISNVDARILGTAGAGRFTGTFAGMYASSNGNKSSGYADFDWFEFIRKP